MAKSKVQSAVDEVMDVYNLATGNKEMTAREALEVTEELISNLRSAEAGLRDDVRGQ